MISERVTAKVGPAVPQRRPGSGSRTHRDPPSFFRPSLFSLTPRQMCVLPGNSDDVLKPPLISAQTSSLLPTDNLLSSRLSSQTRSRVSHVVSQSAERAFTVGQSVSWGHPERGGMVTALLASWSSGASSILCPLVTTRNISRHCHLSSVEQNWSLL